MDIFNPKRTKKDGPEKKIQDDLIVLLRGKEWLVKSTHGNTFQSGFPDLFCAHPRYGARWIEVKNPLAYSFTPAQMEWFPLFTAHGVGIWVLTAATEEEYRKLFKPFNWHCYLNIFKG